MIVFYTSECFAFSYLFASISFVQASAVQFATFCNSTFRFGLVFDNLSKTLIICPQHLDVFMISNRLLTTVPLVIECKPNSSPYAHDYLNILLSETQEKAFSLRAFREILNFET